VAAKDKDIKDGRDTKDTASSDERQREHRRAAAIDALLELRRKQAPVSDAEIAEARRAGRP